MRQNEFRKNSYVVITGIGIGWLVGLSVSPVVSIVITSVTGSAAALIAAMSGLEDKPDKSDGESKRQIVNYRWKINPLPLTLLVIGILLGSIIGVLARNQSWLGSDVSGEITKWTKAGLMQAGLTREDIVRELFESQYISPTTFVTTSNEKPNPLLPVYFAIDATECETLTAAALRPPSDNLVSALRTSTVKQLQNLPNVVTDPQILKAIVEEVLCVDEAG